MHVSWTVQRERTVDGAPLNPHSDSRQQVVVKPVACWDGSGEGQALEGSLAGGTVWTQRQPSAGETRERTETAAKDAERLSAAETRTRLRRVPKVFVRDVCDGGIIRLRVALKLQPDGAKAGPTARTA